MEDWSKYSHSEVHTTVARRDHAGLRTIVSTLPQLAKAGEVNNEVESLEAERVADVVSAAIDYRGVPGRETPLHVAVRLRDAISVEILMGAGADWSLQNESGWSALQEAVCARDESIVMIIARHYQPLAWGKWCRRLPRVIASAARISDFYMEITFHFESSVVPFISRIAPSDTYRIWKRGSNLRADMTLAGFDGLRIQRSDQSFLFLGEGYTSQERRLSLPPGSLVVLSHKDKEVTNALEGAGSVPTEAEVAHEVGLMFQTNVYRPGVDVTQAVVVPRLNWRRQERTETVGSWRAKIHDMLHVTVSMRSRRVPGVVADADLFSGDEDESLMNSGCGGNEYGDVLTAEEKMQLDSALRMDTYDGSGGSEDHGVVVNGSVSSSENSEIRDPVKDKKSWFGWNKKGSKYGSDGHQNSKSIKKSSGFSPEGASNGEIDVKKLYAEVPRESVGDSNKGKDKNGKKKKKGALGDSKLESEFKKGLRPVLWLSRDFPLNTEEFMPFLDILADKVKAIRRLRDVLATKLPSGTFPVKVAIPIVPTVRVVVTFTKFEELQQQSEEFSTPPSSPVRSHDGMSADRPQGGGPSTSWISWMRGGGGGGGTAGPADGEHKSNRDDTDPFVIPSDYTWVDAGERRRRQRSTRKLKNRRNRKTVSNNSGGGGGDLRAIDE